MRKTLRYATMAAAGLLCVACPIEPVAPYVEEEYVAPAWAMPSDRSYDIAGFDGAMYYSGFEFADGFVWCLRNASGGSPYQATLMRADESTGAWGSEVALLTSTGYEFFAYDLAFEAGRLDVISSSRIYRFARSTLSYEGRLTAFNDATVPAQVTGMQGIAVSGSKGFITVYNDRIIRSFDIPSGAGDADVTASTFATLPEGACPRGITLMGGRLYVADAFHDVVYAIDPATGVVDDEFVTYEREAMGIGANGTCLYMRDSSRAAVRPLYFQKLDDWMTRSEPLDVKVTFRATVTNLGASAASARVRAAIPKSDARQDIVSLSYPGYPDCGVDRYGQRYAILSSGQVPPGGSATVEWAADARVWSLKVRIPPSFHADPSSSPASVKDHFLTDSFSYLAMGNSITRSFADSVPGSPSYPSTFARAVRDRVFATLSYVLDGSWDDAATVIQRGTGSCSEYSFVTSAAFRLRGWPTRFVGATTGHKSLSEAVADTVYHRWIEVYVPGRGWVPMDCNHNDSGSTGPWSNELVFGADSRKLVLLKGGCEDGDWLGSGYTYDYVVDSGAVSVSAGYWWELR
jgi:transglutaminase-like putative cysteine protease